MNIIKKAVTMLLVLALTISISAFTDTASASDVAEEKIRKGVMIDSVDVSNMTASEAKKAIKKYVNDKADIKVKLEVDDTKVNTTLKDLGYKWSNQSVVDDAVGIGKTGNIIKRYKDSLDLDKEGKKLNIKMGIDEKTLKKRLKSECSEYGVEAKNASLKLTSSGFKIMPEKKGVVIDYDVTVAGLFKYITEEWDGESEIKYTAQTTVSNAKYTTEDCKKVSDTPMGTYHTNFTTGASYDNRNMNIKNGADKLDGSVIYPGEQFSLNEHLAPWTAENGYYPAGTFVDGGVADSYGGGICQVSSTFYNALLDAEIKVVKRFPHSMAVGYVPLSADAALAGDYKDLVFENNTDAPIYIEAIYSSGGTIKFSVYGHDTRKAGHSVKYESKTLKTVNVKTTITKDNSKPVGYKETIENGHIGYVAELWKVTYENGTEVNREKVHTSTYAMSPKKVIQGTKKKEEKDSKPDKDKKEKETKEEKETKKENKPEKATKKTE